ncbi:putative secreted salivary protein [Ixodes scapularis]
MFKLRFFILFILAGLCFGGDTSSNGEAADATAGAETTVKTFASAVGLPEWITDPKNFMDTLLKQCHPPPYHEEERISNETIMWEKCLYTCRHHENGPGHTKELPDGTPCGNGKKCKNKVCVQEPMAVPSCR